MSPQMPITAGDRSLDRHQRPRLLPRASRRCSRLNRHRRGFLFLQRPFGVRQQYVSQSTPSGISMLAAAFRGAAAAGVPSDGGLSRPRCGSGQTTEGWCAWAPVAGTATNCRKATGRQTWVGSDWRKADGATANDESSFFQEVTLGSILWRKLQCVNWAVSATLPIATHTGGMEATQFDLLRPHTEPPWPPDDPTDDPNVHVSAQRRPAADLIDPSGRSQLARVSACVQRKRWERQVGAVSRRRVPVSPGSVSAAMGTQRSPGAKS